MDTGGFGVGQAPRECPGSPSWRSAACLEFQKRGLSESTDLEVRQQTVKEGKGWTEVILARCSKNRRNRGPRLAFLKGMFECPCYFAHTS